MNAITAGTNVGSLYMGSRSTLDDDLRVKFEDKHANGPEETTPAQKADTAVFSYGATSTVTVDKVTQTVEFWQQSLGSRGTSVTVSVNPDGKWSVLADEGVQIADGPYHRESISMLMGDRLFTIQRDSDGGLEVNSKRAEDANSVDLKVPRKGPMELSSGNTRYELQAGSPPLPLHTAAALAAGRLDLVVGNVLRQAFGW